MSEEFDEGNEHHGCTDFDWDAVYRACGERCDSDEDELRLKAVHALLLLVLRWVVSPALKKRRGSSSAITVARRAVAAAWVMSPELFSANGKEPRSLTEVSAAMGAHKAVMSEITSEFSKRFGFRNKFQMGHGWNFSESNQHENHQFGNN